MSDSKEMYEGKVFTLRRDHGGFYTPENYPMQGEFASRDEAAASFYRCMLDNLAEGDKCFAHAVHVKIKRDLEVGKEVSRKKQDPAS